MASLENIYFPVKHDKPAFALKKEDVTHHRFEGTPAHLQGYISQDVAEGSGSKQFLTISDFPSWLETDVIKSQCDRHLYEYVLEGRPVRPYFDVEYDDGQLDSADVIDNVLLAIATCLAEVGVEVDCASIASIFCATGACNKMPSGVKASFHIILDTPVVFRNTLEHGAFMNKILLPYIEASETLKNTLYWTDKNGARRCVIDSAPYGRTQSFRLPFQSKIGSNRVFVPITKTVVNYCIGLYCDVGELEFITLPCESRAVVETSVPSYSKSTESPEFDFVKAVSNLYTVDFLTGYHGTRNVIWALWNVEQTERMFEWIHELCIRAINYNYRWVCDIIDAWKHGSLKIGSIVYWAEELVGKDAVNKIRKEYPIKYKDELFTAHMKPVKHTVLEQRYLGDSVGFSEDINTLVIKSLLGTGKTVCIKNIITSGTYKRILVVSPRKSYTYSQSGELVGFTSYLEKFYGDLASEARIIVQVESLHRIGNGFQKYDLVILDEIESILNQLHSIKTNGSNLITNHQVLSAAVSTAGRVILADAFISDRTFNFCNSLRNREQSHYFENTFNPYCREAIFLRSTEKDKRIANIGGFCERIIEALRAGRRIVVVWTSKRRGDWFVKEFLEKWEGDCAPSWIYYNSASTKEEQESLKNVNESWRTVQCLMMTTSITVGISYDPKIADIEFDEAFLYGSSASAMPRDIAQALFRVRTLKANRLTYVLDTRTSYDCGVRGFANIYNELSKKEDKLIREHPLVKWTMSPEWAKWNFSWCENEERNSRAEYKDVLENYLVLSGYTLKSVTHIPTHKVAAIKVDLDDREAIMWDNVDDIDYAVAEDIHKAIKRGEAGTEDILRRKKFIFRQQFVDGCCEEDLKSAWSRFFESGSEKQFWNVVHEKCWTVDDVARSEAVKRYAGMSGDSVKERETIERFLKIVGMSYSQEECIIEADKIEEIGRVLSSVEKDIVEGLGLRKSRRKGDWKVANTIDLITAVLQEWGCGSVESSMKQLRRGGKVKREYCLDINKNNKLWNNIHNYNINYDENLIVL
jgi:hypothetical protein